MRPDVGIEAHAVLGGLLRHECQLLHAGVTAELKQVKEEPLTNRVPSCGAATPVSRLVGRLASVLQHASFRDTLLRRGAAEDRLATCARPLRFRPPLVNADDALLR